MVPPRKQRGPGADSGSPAWPPLRLGAGPVAEATRDAVEMFWRTLESQASATDSGDRGNRAGVTGGKQMDGVAAVLVRTASSAGMPAASIHVDSQLELPGYFRPEKKWDFLVVHEGNLVAAAELKSHVGPSFGNNYNNRSEEAIGSGLDLSRAFKSRPNPSGKPPWIGWLMLLEHAPRSTTTVRLKQPHFKVDPKFEDTSYAERYAELCRTLVADGLYSSSALLLAPRAPRGDFSEPEAALGMLPFLASLSRACRPSDIRGE